MNLFFKKNGYLEKRFKAGEGRKTPCNPRMRMALNPQQGGVLSIRLRFLARATGVGIPEEAKAKLFTPLFTTKSKGQGFGLAVVKRVVESMDGEITFKSQESKGTTFTLRLPNLQKN